MRASRRDVGASGDHAIGEQGGNQSGGESHSQTGESGLLKGGLGEKSTQIGLQAGDDHLAERQDEKKGGKHQEKPVGEADKRTPSVEAREASTAGDTGVRCCGQEAQAGEDQARHRDLQECQRHGALRIEVEAQRLVDGNLDGRRRGSTTEDQHEGETRHAQHEDQACCSGDHTGQNRPLDEAEGGKRRETEARRHAPVFRRYPLEGRQHQAGCQRQVEEDMGDEDAGQPVDRDRLIEAKSGQRIVDDAASAEDADQPERADQDWQSHRHGHQPDQPDAAGKIGLSGERTGDRQGQAHGEKRGEEGLPERKRENRADDGISKGGEKAARQSSREQGSQRDADESRDDQQNEKATRKCGQPLSS